MLPIVTLRPFLLTSTRGKWLGKGSSRLQRGYRARSVCRFLRPEPHRASDYRSFWPAPIDVLVRIIGRHCGTHQEEGPCSGAKAWREATQVRGGHV